MKDRDHEPFAPLPEAAPCPFCDGTDTRLLSPFGGQLSVAQYWCRSCRTGFDFMKWGESAGGAPPPPSR